MTGLSDRLPSWPQQTGAELELIAQVLSGSAWGSAAGHQVADAERAIAALQDAPGVVACANGTVALMAALAALDLPYGSEVIVPSYTFIATAGAALQLGLVPVFWDTAPGSFLVDPAVLPDLITERTGAIIPVHLGGAPCDMAPIVSVARARGIPVIEDAAQAIGASYGGTPLPVGDLATFSFQSSKNLTAGEGGAVITRDPVLAERVWSYVNVGRVRGGAWYDHRNFGLNLRLSEVQGAILVAQLRRLPELQARRQHGAERLADALADVPGLWVAPVRLPAGSVHGQHLFLMRVVGQAHVRAGFLARLGEAGLPTASAGYVPLHQAPALIQQTAKLCDALGRALPTPHCPNTEQVAAETVWLPQQILLADDDVLDEVADVIRTALAEAAA